MWAAVTQQQGMAVPPEQFNWQARLNLSVDGGLDDEIAGFNTLRPTSPIASSTVFSSLTDSEGNPLTGVTLTMESANVVAESSTGPSEPDADLYNQRWRGNGAYRLAFGGLDDTKNYTVQILTQEQGVTEGQVVSTYIYLWANNQQFEDISRDATMEVPNDYGFDDETWVRFDDIIPSGGIFKMLVQRNGSIARHVTHAIIITEYDIAIGGVQEYHVNGETTSPFPYVSYTPNGSGLKPAFIFLHGAGERGAGALNNLQDLTNRFGPNRTVKAGRWKHDAYCFTPQCPTTDYWSEMPLQTMIDFIDHLKANHDIDPDRIYFIGYSDGGLGIGLMLDNTVGNRLFPAAVCITSEPRGYKYRDDSAWNVDPANMVGVPVKVFVNSGDPIYLSSDAIAGVAEVNALDPGIQELTVFTGYTHTFAQKIVNGTGMGSMVDPTYDPFDQNIYDWLLGHTL